MNYENIIQHTLIAGTSLWQGVSTYKESRMHGSGKAVSLLKSVGDVAAWSLFPGLMMSTMVPQLIAPVAQAAYQSGYSRYTHSRALATPFGTHLRGGYDTTFNQQRRYSAVRELSDSFNIARAQAHRMRSW